MQADTKDAEKNLETLKGRERELAEQSVATQKSINESSFSRRSSCSRSASPGALCRPASQFASSAPGGVRRTSPMKAGGADKRRADEFRKSLDDWRDSMKQRQDRDR
jgi:hypothetical protein